MPIRITGVAETLAKLTVTAALAREASIAALEEDVREGPFARSQEIVPLDLGPLQASGRVTVDGQTVTISYGQDDDPNIRGETTSEYAVIQHENLSFNHAEGRQAKYVEQPALESAQGAETRLAVGIRKRVA